MTAQNAYNVEDAEKKFYDLLEKLDARVTLVERALGQAAPGTLTGSRPRETKAIPATDSRRSGLELKIGEYALAWFGSVILLLGIAFLMTYTHALGYRLAAGCLGFAASLTFYSGARAWSRSIPYLSNLMVSASVITLFYSTVRLHYFTAEPLVTNVAVAFPALLGVVAFAIYLAVRRKSEPGAILGIVLGMITCLLSPSPYAGLALLAVIALVASFLAVQRDWWAVVILTSLLVYCGHLLWLMNNPLIGGRRQTIAADEYSLIFLFLCAVIFVWPALAREYSSEEGPLALVLFNCAGFSFILGMAVFALYAPKRGPAFLAAGGFFVACSIAQWLKTRKQLAPAIYACSGYLALSIGISGFAEPPALFLWLALQSLLVVCMALWFRSKIIVVANSIIFLGILASYVGGFPSSNWVNFSFALVAHASARIMNWQKERLTLRTEMLRNVYLLIGFVFVLYGLAHALPAHYVTLSWIGAAASYFLVSILLDNHKYRWLAVTSVLVTIVYLLAVDLPQLDAKYRVPAFLAVGIITLVISMYCTRFRQVHGAKQ